MTHRWDVTCLLAGGGAITYMRIWADTKAEAIEMARYRILGEEPGQTVALFRVYPSEDDPPPQDNT